MQYAVRHYMSRPEIVISRQTIRNNRHFYLIIIDYLDIIIINSHYYESTHNVVLLYLANEAHFNSLI